MTRRAQSLSLALALACSLGGRSAGPAGAFALNRLQDSSNGQWYPCRWSSVSRPIRFMLSDSPKSVLPNFLSDSVPTAAVQATMQAWSFSPLGMTLAGTTSKTSTAQDNVNLITLANTAANRDATGNSIALTQMWLYNRGSLKYWQIAETDVVFNPTVPVATDGRANAYDLQAVLTHELGHALGCDHSSIPAATMWPYGDQGETRDRTPDADDAAAVQAIYGDPQDPDHATISGKVLAAGDVPVFGATVIATDQQGVARCGAFTEHDGSYTLSWLPPGVYSVHAEPLNSELTTEQFSADYYHGAWRGFPAAFLGSNSSPALVAVKAGDAVTVNPIRIANQRPRLAIQVLGSAPDGQHFAQFGLQAITMKPGATTYLLVGAEGLTPATDIQASGTDIGFDKGNVWVDQLSDGTPFAFLPMSIRPGATPGARNLYLSTNAETSAFSGAIKVLAP